MEEEWLLKGKLKCYYKKKRKWMQDRQDQELFTSSFDHVPGPVLSAGDPVVNKTLWPLFWSLWSTSGDKSWKHNFKNEGWIVRCVPKEKRSVAGGQYKVCGGGTGT